MEKASVGEVFNRQNNEVTISIYYMYIISYILPFVNSLLLIFITSCPQLLRPPQNLSNTLHQFFTKNFSKKRVLSVIKNFLVSTNCQQIPILGHLCRQYNQSENPLKPLPERICYGGPGEDRTPDLRVANAALSQLSYEPQNPTKLLYHIIPKKSIAK